MYAVADQLIIYSNFCMPYIIEPNCCGISLGISIENTLGLMASLLKWSHLPWVAMPSGPSAATALAPASLPFEGHRIRNTVVTPPRQHTAHPALEKQWGFCHFRTCAVPRRKLITNKKRARKRQTDNGSNLTYITHYTTLF